MVISEQIKRIAKALNSLHKTYGELQKIEDGTERAPVKVKTGVFVATNRVYDAISGLDKVLEFLEEGRE